MRQSTDSNDTEQSTIPKNNDEESAAGQGDNNNGPPDETHSTCVICLNDYEEGEEIVRAEKCHHMYHKECLLNWLAQHDICPYCRLDVMTSDEYRKAAIQVLGDNRVLSVVFSFGPSALNATEGV